MNVGKMLFHLKIFASFLILVSCVRSFSRPPPIAGAVGQYYNGAGGLFPMLVASKDGGNTWAYKISDTLLPQPNAAANPLTNFVSVSCSRSLCSAGGSYSNGTGQFPMLVVSTDAGDTWSYKMSDTLLPPPHASPDPDAILISVSCSGSLCSAVGSYSDNAGGAFPMLVVSTDRGNTWSYKISDTLLPLPHAAANPQAQLISVSCSGSLCAAAGNYSNDTGQFPVLVVSTDGGNTWSYKIYDTLLPPPNAAASPQAYFKSVSCSGSLCVAGGSYLNDTGQFPLLVVSTDGGNTWSYKIYDTLLPPPNAAANPLAYFNSVSCSENLCSAAGHYFNGTGYFPILVVSTDGGNIWSYKIYDTLLPPPNAATEPDADFDSVSCSGNLCSVIGGYVNLATETFPMLVVSTDGGNTWSYKISDTLLPPPNAALDPAAYNPKSVSCGAGFFCSAVTSYTNMAGGTFPMLVVSTDGGNTWSYKISDTLLLPPNGAANPQVTFNGVSSGSL